MQRTGGENEGTRPADRHSPATDSLAEDVARLYSWANLGENSYRSFARIRQPRPLPPPDTAKGTSAPDQNDPSKEPVRVRFSDPSKRPAGSRRSAQLRGWHLLGYRRGGVSKYCSWT